MTAALREKLHRWQQIESLTGFALVHNPGLGALATALNLDPTFLGLRPPTPQHLLLSDDLDDMDEDILSPGTMQCNSAGPEKTLYRHKCDVYVDPFVIGPSVSLS